MNTELSFQNLLINLKRFKILSPGPSYLQGKYFPIFHDSHQALANTPAPPLLAHLQSFLASPENKGFAVSTRRAMGGRSAQECGRSVLQMTKPQLPGFAQVLLEGSQGWLWHLFIFN